MHTLILYNCHISPDATIDPWMKELWLKLADFFPIPPELPPIGDKTG